MISWTKFAAMAAALASLSACGMPDKPSESVGDGACELVTDAPEGIRNPLTLTVDGPSRDPHRGTPMRLNVKLQLPDGSPAGKAALERTHTQYVHVLAVDAYFRDYHHIHPKAGKKPGEWIVKFTPNEPTAYHLWVDTRAKGDSENQQLHSWLGTPPDDMKPLVRPEKLEATSGPLRAKLTLDHPMQAGKMAMLTLHVTDSRGRDVKRLQPLMHAFAHAVGFSPDGQQMLHVHPMGAEPEKESDRDGPEVMLHVTPPQPGTLPFFVQVKVDNKVRTFAFDLTIH